MKKRVVSLLLCLIMALSLIPTAAFATEVENVEEPTTTVETQDAAENQVAVQNRDHNGGDPKPTKTMKWDWLNNSWGTAIPTTADTNGLKYVKVNGSEMTQADTSVAVADVQQYGVVIGVNAGYYLSQYTIRCHDKYNCQTAAWGNDTKATLSNEGKAEVVLDLSEANFTHTNNSRAYWLLLKFAQDDTKYTVAYNWGDLTDKMKTAVPVDANSYLVNEAVTVVNPSDSANTEAATLGYKFVGWALDGQSVGTSFAMPQKNVTLVAQWEKVEAPTSRLNITKRVVGLSGTDVPATFAFTVTGPNDYSQSVNIAGNHSLMLLNVPIGEYSVTENTVAAQVPGYTLTTSYSVVYASGSTPVSINNSTIEVKPNSYNEIIVTNTYTLNDGKTVYNPASLTIVKKDARTDALLSGATFQLSKKDDATGKFVEVGTAITPAATGSINFDNLLPGSYELKETAAPSDYVGWTERTFSFSVVADDEGESRYNKDTNAFDTVYNCSIIFDGDTSEEHIVGNNIFYRNYSYVSGTLTIYNERIETVTIPVKKIVEAPYAPADEKEFKFHVVLAPDSNNTFQFDDVDLLSDLSVSFNGEKLTYDAENERYSFTLKASSTKDGEGTLTLTGTRNDLNGLKVIVFEEDESEENPNWTYAEDPCGALLSYSKEANGYVLVNDDDETVNVPFTFTNTYVKMQPITATLDITKNVVRERGSRRPGSADFTFEASYVDLSNHEKEVLIELGTLTIKTTGGEKSYTKTWELTIPAEAFNEDGWAKLVISEVNGKLSGWTYSDVQYELIVTKDGEISENGKPQALNDEEVAPGINLAFTNSYYKRTSSPNPPADKPIKSVKTGDMGIAMYAMTSLLSLGGAALVIKKRKDEE